MFDKDFFDIIKPIYFIYLIFCTPKYVFTDLSIDLIGKKHIILNVCGLSVMIFLMQTVLRSMILNDILLYIYCTSYSIYVCNFSIVCLLNTSYREVNAEIVRQLSYLNWHLFDSAQSKQLKYILRISCIILISMYISLLTHKLLNDPSWNISRGLFLVTSMVIDIELIHVIFIVCFLIYKTEKWIETVKTANYESFSYNCPGTAQEISECVRLLILFQAIADSVRMTEKSARLVVSMIA